MKKIFKYNFQDLPINFYCIKLKVSCNILHMTPFSAKQTLKITLIF